MFWLASSSFASETELQGCMAGNDQEKIECLGKLKAAYDTTLNSNYKIVLAKASAISNSVKKDLVAAEKAWLNFRDTSCAFERSWEQGSLGRVAYVYCQAKMTDDRSVYLDQYAK